MQQKFNDYWQSVPLTSLFGIILDPRCNVGFAKFFLEKEVGKEDMERQVANAVAGLAALLSTYIDSVPTSVFPAEEDPCHDPLMREFLSNQTSPSPGNVELENYTQRQGFLHGGLNILQWWRGKEQEFPLLRLMAKDLLSIQLSSVASEANFLQAGMIVNYERSCLSPSTVTALVRLQNGLNN